MKTSLVKLFILAISGLSFSSHAEVETSNSESGFKIGGGFFGASRVGSNSNSICLGGYSGYSYEIGYDFNNIVGIESKYATADDTNGCNVAISYIGLNIGHDFNTEWFRLYGKVGYANVKEDEINASSFSDHDYHYYSNSGSGVAFGIGSRFTFSGEASGLYLTLESIVDEIQNNNIGPTVLIGLGYRF
jgi:hypothetical protein